MEKPGLRDLLGDTADLLHGCAQNGTVGVVAGGANGTGVAAQDFERLLNHDAESLPFVTISAGEFATDFRNGECPTPVWSRSCARALNGRESIIFYGMHHRFPELALLCDELFDRHRRTAKMDLFCSGSSAPGLAPHVDQTDQVVVQVSGHSGGASTSHGRCRRSPGRGRPRISGARARGRHVAGAVDRSFTLEPGDVAFIALDRPHEARNVGGDASMHLTFGVWPTRLVDLLQTWIATWAEEDDRWLQVLPVEAVEASPPPGLSRQLAALAADRLDARAPPDLGRRAHESALAARVRRRDDLGWADRRLFIVRRWSTDALRVRSQCDTMVIDSPMGPLAIGEKAREAVEVRLHRAGAFDADDLPGPLTGAERRELVIQLLPQGVVRMAGVA